MENKVKVKKTNKIWNWIKENWWKVLVSFGSVMLVAGLAAIFTDTKSDWYVNLIKPVFYPPAIVFPIIWNVLYLSLAIILFILIYKKQGNNATYILFGVNGLLNVLWTLTFFIGKNTFLSLIVLAGNLIAGVLLFLEIRKVNKKLSYAIIPYVAWLAFAFILNYLIYLLN